MKIRKLRIKLLFIFLLLATSFIALYGFLKWDHFTSLRLIHAQVKILDGIGYEFAKGSAFNRQGFKEIFLNPQEYKASLDEIFLDKDSSLSHLELAGDLIQCRRKGELYQLATEIVESFSPPEASQRLVKIFLPSNYASTYRFNPALDDKYMSWLRYIEKHSAVKVYGIGVDKYIQDGRIFYTNKTANPDALIYPKILCPDYVNVADISVRVEGKVSALGGFHFEVRH